MCVRACVGLEYVRIWLRQYIQKFGLFKAGFSSSGFALFLLVPFKVTLHDVFLEQRVYGLSPVFW